MPLLHQAERVKVLTIPGGAGVPGPSGVLLGRRFDSYIEGFALQPGISEFLAVDMGGSIATESFRQESIEEAKKAKALFESFMQEHSVPRSGEAASGLSFSWL